VIRYDSSQRLYICGRTGTGKSTLALELARRCASLVVYDPKWQITVPGARVVEGAGQGLAAARRELAVIVRPGLGEERPELVDELALIVLARGNSVLWLDELPTWPQGTRPGLYDLLRRGRALGAGVIACTQRPHRVPLELMSEADTLAAFRLHLERDRERVGELAGDQARHQVAGLVGHQFVLADLAAGTDPQVCELKI
jgi:hypothetical protein